MTARNLPFIALLLCAAVTANAVEVKPVVEAQLLGGQNYYSGSESSFGGYASLSAAPYLKWNDKWSLVPLYVGNYRGTKQVTDLIGGGTLFQDSQDHTVSTKLIRTFSNGLKYKAVAGYGIEMLRETKDEDWGKGLYDNQRLFGGAEAEWEWKKENTVRLAYDAYKLRFSNYESLESGQVDNGLGRELSQPDVLDNQNHKISLDSRFALPFKGHGDIGAGYVFRRYPDQHIVLATGELSPDTRDDAIQMLSARGTWLARLGPRKYLFSSFGYNWSHLYSDQNHYDAGQTVFTANYYAYVTQTLSTEWTLLLGNEANPMSFTLNGALSRQQYSDRRIQDATGVYGFDDTDVDSAYAGLNFSYPITKNFRLAANAYFGWQDSNNQDNRVYQYHYQAQTYLMGFTYAY